MAKALIVCRSITYAQKVMHMVNRAGCWAGLDKTPSQIRMKNCSYSVTIAEKDLVYITNLLNSNNISNIEIYIYQNNEYKKINGGSL